MDSIRSSVALTLTLIVAGCASAPITAPNPGLPPANSAGAVPSGVIAAAGYRVSVFAVIPHASSAPDSLAQIGTNVFVGVGDDLGPDGSPGPSGKRSVEIYEYNLSGTLEKTLSVPGHNDGLMAYDGNTLWTMSNEDCNPKLVVINITTGSQQVYSLAPSLLSAAGCIANTNGGLDDMALIGGTVYVSASNPNPTPPQPCPADSSTPGCPNGVSTANAVYALTLNGNATFNLTPVLTSGRPALDVATGTSRTLNMTDPDSEAVMPDGSTLVVDSQQDSELALINQPGAHQTVTYLPLTLGGALTAVDDTRWVTNPQSFMLFTDTPKNYVYRVDGSFAAGAAYSSAPSQVASLNTRSGVLTPVVSGLGAPHGLIFVTPTGQ